jgi:hypothetical protein
MKPTVGRIVHYRGDEFNGVSVHPAIVTRVWNDGLVNLTVFPDAHAPIVRTSVYLLSKDDNAKNTAFWPPITE